MNNSIMEHFDFADLSGDMLAVSRRIYDLAFVLDATIPDSAEKSAGLRKLLEAKDCFVRAVIP